jgi:hypothetical protein
LPDKGGPDEAKLHLSLRMGGKVHGKGESESSCCWGSVVEQFYIYGKTYLIGFLYLSGVRRDNTSEAQASLGRLPSMIKMSSFHYLRKMAALVAASLILPALAYADRDNDKDDHGRGDNEKGGERHGDPRVSSVPEANTVWVLRY